MRMMATYDLMEAGRITQQWLGAAAQAIGTHPFLTMTPNPAANWLRGWGEVTERTFKRMSLKPEWGILPLKDTDGLERSVETEIVTSRPFGDLLRFVVEGRETPQRKVLLVAPMSGHYATLLRATVTSLLPDVDLYITDWHNARDIPVGAGKFDVEDYTLYLVDFIREVGSEAHVIAVCQPAPLTLAATAYLAQEDPTAQPLSLTLIGGPIDPSAARTEVTDFGDKVDMRQLEKSMIQRVGNRHAGAGREVYPGLMQLTSFVAMNADKHASAFRSQIARAAAGEVTNCDKHNTFYDEYLSVMDMPAEFYLSTVDRIFKKGEIARNAFTVAGKTIDIRQVSNVAIMTIEGEADDITAPGQCIAALTLCSGLPAEKKFSHVEPGAGHYGIFAGSSWRNNIRPLVLTFMSQREESAKEERKRSVSKKRKSPR
ncbi:polyhydroxyalkanoate depolymerase [Loktanella sp. DJP18]|uniref:polyhydroxyalkanoate depolymerase n=1 Tax=Loktanella sp. DJP18 TaxID=3409788 RepID=UPI003BB61D5E